MFEETTRNMCQAKGTMTKYMSMLVETDDLEQHKATCNGSFRAHAKRIAYMCFVPQHPSCVDLQVREPWGQSPRPHCVIRTFSLLSRARTKRRLRQQEYHMPLRWFFCLCEREVFLDFAFSWQCRSSLCKLTGAGSSGPS